MEGIMKIKSFLTGAVAVASLALSAASAQATTDVFNFADNVDGIFAIGTFTIDDTANASGTFDITNVTGTVIDAQPATPVVDQIVGLVGNPSSPSPTDNFGFIYDNVTPLNVNGVLFSGQSGALYNLWSNGGTNGELYTYGLNGVPNFDAHGTLSVGGVPEPATWAMMLIGFGGLGASLRGARRKASLVA
jgi:hypothetical protein